ncbi:MAG: TonB family protein [Polyangiales bacterium]
MDATLRSTETSPSSAPEARPTEVPVRRVDEGSRAGLFIAVALGLHVLAALSVPAVKAVTHLIRDPNHWISVDPPEAPPEALPALETPPPPPPTAARRIERPETPPAEAPPAPQPEASPPAAQTVPDEQPVVPQATVGTSSVGGLAVGVAVGDGSLGGSAHGTRHESPVGTPAPVAEAAPNPSPFRRAYAARVREVVGQPRYTNGMRHARIEGVVRIGITIDPRGHVTGVRVVTSSGNPDLDAHVLEYVRGHVDDLPAPPTEAQWATNEVKFGYTFSLED